MILRPRPGHPYTAGAPLFIAHRGGAGLAPENTMHAFRAAVERWEADILEMDVHATADGELVVIHDPTVDRTTDGRGAVRDLTLREIQRLDAGCRFTDPGGAHSFRGRGVVVPRFADVLEAFPGVRMNVDAKGEATTPRVIDAVRAAGAEHRVLLASVGEEGRADRHGYRGPTSASRRQIRLFYYLHRLPGGGPYTPRTDALQIPYRWEGRQVATPRFIREASRRNLPVHVWTVDDPEVMRTLLAWGVGGIQTDRPDLLAAVLCRETGRPPPPGLGPP